jgi:hypothetical protein
MNYYGATQHLSEGIVRLQEGRDGETPRRSSDEGREGWMDACFGDTWSTEEWRRMWIQFQCVKHMGQ